MAKFNKGYKFDRELLVDKIVDMRIEGASTKTILDFLMNDIGYEQANSYDILKDAQLKIKSIYTDKHEVAFEEAKSRLERLYESTSDKKLKLQIQNELSKLMGLHKAQKIDVTTNGKDITDINIEIIYTNNEIKDKGEL